MDDLICLLMEAAHPVPNKAIITLNTTGVLAGKHLSGISRVNPGSMLD